ncbi:MAG: putative metal-dependent hydrolase [Acidobacteria bacterium]|nr:putative metal-dependent hydrolase [Acidobacteriota bacterium]
MSGDPRYPIGKFQYDGPLTPEQRSTMIEAIENTPVELRKSIRGLVDEQLATPYRDGGWTVRQLIHHVADSHINAYCRFRLALTEDNPTIKPYEEQLWAELSDGAKAPIGLSLAILDALHVRWSMLLRSLTPEEFARPVTHPASGQHSIDWLLAVYSWHGAHHTAHVTELRKAKGW